MKPTHTFVSYSRHDVQFTDKLRVSLIANGVQVWRDRENIPLGENWDSEIEKALRSGLITHVLFIQSRQSVVSTIVLNELAEAYENRLKIIPLLLDDSKTPLIIKRLNHVDFRDNYEIALQVLLAEISASSKKYEEIPDDYEEQEVFRIPTEEQRTAAQDKGKHIRLLAGPGTGKSFVVEERVRWLLEGGKLPKGIFVVSFTRASSVDLRDRIIDYCHANGQREARSVQVSTLHSLALKALKKCGALDSYPTGDPLVLDDWELEHIFDAEFKEKHGDTFARIDGRVIRKRAEEVRRFFEALWSTGEENPRDYLMPEIPISETEKAGFDVFHRQFTRTYSCVLPGEIVATCVKRIDAGLLDPTSLLGVEHLIVDEFQDLNNADTEFIHSIASSNVSASIYVLGDDDQSIYSFRFAYPLGIQSFTNQYSNSANYILSSCFRCTPQILGIASSLISQYPLPQRIPKSISSVYEEVKGIIYRHYFRSEQREGYFIAQACKKLIQGGINPEEILVLISSRDTQLKAIVKGFERADVKVELPTSERFIDTPHGRYCYAILRVAIDLGLKDYIAHRLILGLPNGTGVGTCISIREKIVQYNLKYLEIFYYDLPKDVFTGRELTAIKKARNIFDQVSLWTDESLLEDHKRIISEMVTAAFDDPACGEAWLAEIKILPIGTTLKETATYLSTQSLSQRAEFLKNIYKRLNLETPSEGFTDSRVQIMTMHGAKGLNAKVVFIPGLENEIIPSKRRREYPGLYLEAARLLYVSITRASIACFLTFSASRQMGKNRQYNRDGSDFLTTLQGRFTLRDHDLTDNEAEAILVSAGDLQKSQQDRFS